MGWMIDVIKCCLEGDINKKAIILSGPQGIGKSRWISGLVPWYHEEDKPNYSYYGFIDFDFNMNDKLANTLILEFQEFMADDASKLIHILNVASVRLPYQIENSPRRASFIGSTNKKFSPRTPFNELMIISLKGINYAKPDTDQLWAQAVDLYYSKKDGK
jgi:predicted P-loop ATPase